jgi:hypothetical protein
MIGLPTLAVTGLLASAPASSAPAVLLQGSTPAARLAPGSTAPAGPTTSTTVADSPGLVSVLAGQLPRPAPRTTTTRARSSRPPAPSRTTVARRPPPPSPEPILAIGDSVLLAASPALSQAFAGHITIDAQVGRQVQAGLDRLQAYRASGALGKYRTVLIDLGTNGTFLPAQFSELVELVKGVPHVIVYNVHAARPWAATSNATIAAGVASDPHQMLMVDWDHVITTPLLYSDEIHPDPAGAGVYAHLLAAAIKAPTA